MSSRWLSYLFCLLGLPVYLWGLQGQRHIGALPADVVMGARPFPVRIEGVEAYSPAQLRSLIERYPPGREVRIENGGFTRTVRLVPAFPPAHHVISMISALFFWTVCFFVFAERPERDPGRVFFLSTFAYGLAISMGTVALPAEPRDFDMLRPVVRTVCIALLPVFFLQISLVFPRRRPVANERPWLLPLLFLTGLGLAALRSAALLNYLSAPSPTGWSASVWSEGALNLFVMVLVGAGCLLMFQNGRRAELAREKQQLKWLWWGITVGTTPFVFLYTLPTLLGAPEIVPLHVTRLFAMAVPVAFAFAAVKYRLLDIDVIIRRSLIYGVLAGVFAAVYLFLMELLGRRIAPIAPGIAPYVPISAALVSVLLYGPTRHLVGAWVDRTFFQIRHSYGQALRRLRMALGRPRDLKDLAHYMRRFVSRMLASKSTSVIARSGADLVTVGGGDDAVARWAMTFLDEQPGRRDHLLAAPNTTSMPEIESGDYPAELLEAGVVLVQPMAADDNLFGLLLLGEKKSERRYIEEDISWLAGVGAAGGAAVERLNLAQRVAEERLVHERMNEINRMKSDFLSRVAHDLRTPVTSIDWSARNLLDGLAGPLREEQTTYLQAILTSAIHLNRLVTNLLEINRLEEGTSAIELGPVRIASVAEEAVVGLAPIAAAREVRLVPCIGSNLTPVLGNREKLLQVLVNLLENAIRYSPSGSQVRITAQRDGDGAQTLTIRDAGPGIAAGDEAAIFERFRQGPPSPHAQPQGFGLGLFVVKAHVEACSGTVRAGNHPDGGAEFVVRLREWTEPRVALV